MKPGTIFKFGTGMAFGRTFNFVAKRGDIHDWAIYTTLNSQPIVDMWVADEQGIAAYGLKLGDKKLIRELMPCDDEAFEMYRF